MTKKAQDIQPGDAIVFLGEEHRVNTLEPYIGPFAKEVFAIARAADGWGITLFYNTLVEVAA